MSQDKFTVFDELIKSRRETLRRSFWTEGKPICSRAVLGDFIGAAAKEGKSARSGSVASAVDMWLAEELRAAGFPEDHVWPRASRPRVLDPRILRFVEKLPKGVQEQVQSKIESCAGSTDQNVLGDAYVKQVDVGVASDWPDGPQLLISTKTMSGSFGKNIGNRFEEAYGDAKNLRGRYPKAAIGFFYLVHSDVLNEKQSFAKLTASLQKLQAPDDIYDAVALVVADWGEDGATLIEAGPAGLSIDAFLYRLIKRVIENSAPDAYPEIKEILA